MSADGPPPPPKRRPRPEPAELAAGLAAGERRALSQAITLIESTRPADRPQAEALLASLPALPAPVPRVAVTGPPGAGKSTLIEALGAHLLDRGQVSKLAVLAIDPSSPTSGGSVLGDKTRMPRLSTDARCFVRPTATRGTLGGVAARTADAIRLVEAWGAELVLIETVGVGQSETTAASLSDVFLLLALSGAGDELQAIKRGVVELADLIAVNKADGPNAEPARTRAAELARALELHASPGAWTPRALAISALQAEGLEALWAGVSECIHVRREAGELAKRRQAQELARYDALLREAIVARFMEDDASAQAHADALRALERGELTASAAVRRVIEGRGV